MDTREPKVAFFRVCLLSKTYFSATEVLAECPIRLEAFVYSYKELGEEGLQANTNSPCIDSLSPCTKLVSFSSNTSSV